MTKYSIELNGYSFYEQEKLTYKQVEELLKHYYKYKDDKTKERLIYLNLKLVLSVVKKYNNRKEHLEDLFQVGVIGLIKAIDNFNPTYNLKFSTYAVPLILGEIKKYIRDISSIKIPRTLRDISYKIIQEKENYIKKHNKEPDIKYLSKKLNIDEYTIVEAISSSITVTSLSQEIHNDGQGIIDIESQLQDYHHNYDNVNSLIDLNKALNKLTKQELYVIDKRYYKGKTQMELADELFISQAQVSRIEKKALSHLKKLMDI